MNCLRRYDIAILLGILLLFCCGMGLLHGINQPSDQKQKDAAMKNVLVMVSPSLIGKRCKKRS